MESSSFGKNGTRRSREVRAFEGTVSPSSTTQNSLLKTHTESEKSCTFQDFSEQSEWEKETSVRGVENDGVLFPIVRNLTD
jgi:hypothetical protein